MRANIAICNEKQGKLATAWAAWNGAKGKLAPGDERVALYQARIDRGIALDLEAGGVPKDRIVLAFQHIGRRRFGDYAAA